MITINLGLNMLKAKLPAPVPDPNSKMFFLFSSNFNYYLIFSKLFSKSKKLIFFEIKLLIMYYI